MGHRCDLYVCHVEWHAMGRGQGLALRLHVLLVLLHLSCLLPAAGARWKHSVEAGAVVRNACRRRDAGAREAAEEPGLQNHLCKLRHFSVEHGWLVEELLFTLFTFDC